MRTPCPGLHLSSANTTLPTCRQSYIPVSLFLYFLHLLVSFSLFFSYSCPLHLSLCLSHSLPTSLSLSLLSFSCGLPPLPPYISLSVLRRCDGDTDSSLESMQLSQSASQSFSQSVSHQNDILFRFQMGHTDEKQPMSIIL